VEPVRRLGLRGLRPGVCLAKKGLWPSPFRAKNRQALVVGYIKGMWNLTREQRRVICAVILLLLVGWGVKAWRLAHPPAQNAVVSLP
jgi:hypothetical protein